MPTNVTRRRDIGTRRCSLDLALVCALAAIAAVPSADAARPSRGAKLVSHDHSTPGDGWHVELTISRDARRVSQLVLHDERCRATVLARNVPIEAGGAIDAARPFTSRGRSGAWELSATFPDAGHAAGSFQLMLPDCTGPVRRFRAHASGHGHRHVHGTQPGRYPDLSRATPARRAEARRLWRSSVRESRGRFATYRRARRLGFKPLPGLPSRRPQLFHLRHPGYTATPGSFDARRPESLVYWNPPRSGEPVLIAFMYRVRPGSRPRFAAPLLGWHSHRAGASQMTHVWLTGALRSALANCLPVAALEAAIPRYRFDPAGVSTSLESIPCPVEASS
jgi:hypothetical protein